MTWSPCTVALGELQPWERNPKRLSKTQAARLLASWETLGQFQTLAIGPAGEVYDGHQRLSALLKLHGPGYTVQALRSDRALTEQERKQIAVLSVTAVGSFDWDALSGWDASELTAWGLDADTLAAWNDDAANLALLLEAEQPAQVEDAEPQIDRAEELREKWGVETGQLWQLGEHRLICGDCTDAAVVARVTGGEKADMVFTDPPYGHNNNNGDLIHNREAALGRPKTASSAARPIANDGAEANDLVRRMFMVVKGLLVPGGCCCCCCCGGGPDPQFARWSLWLDEVIPFKMCVVWDKGGLGMGWHYRRNWECILVAEQPGAKCKWYGGNDVPNVIRDIGKIIPSAEQHPTEKPIELAEWFMKLHSQQGEIVFDPFLGSGTTLIACERLGRRCRAAEIDPRYVAVTLQRWADATGKTPVRVERDGTPN